MDLFDFLTGLCLLHAMPHFILGVWNRKMYSPFGTSRTGNIVYSVLLIILSASLFIYKNGLPALETQGIFVGAFCTMVLYLLAAPLIYKNMRASSRRH